MQIGAHIMSKASDGYFQTSSLSAFYINIVSQYPHHELGALVEQAKVNGTE